MSTQQVSAQKFWRTPLDSATIARKRGVLHIIEDRCKGCAYCVDFCPRDVLARSQRFNMKGYHPPDIPNPDACVACGFCELVCPEFAIAVEEIGAKEVAHAG